MDQSTVSVLNPASTDSPDWAIKTSGLQKSYGSFHAIGGVDLAVPPGSIYGLLGPNGSGKSTLIKILVGASRPTSGSVRILGLDPIKRASALRPRIGYMPQSPALYDDLSARDNVRFFTGAHLLPDLDKKVEEAISFVALAERQRDPVYSFSGGMRQRVSLACAIAHEPEILFLDEPTAGVDPKLKESFWQHFRDLAARGVTLFISTHLMDEALLCDQLTILRSGRILITSPPRAILQRGRTVVKVWRGDQVAEYVIHHYFTELPKVLRQYGLDPDVSRIELHEDSLETVLLGMIEEAPK
jgi:ABC-2 type transport system ATP-binding protein